MKKMISLLMTLVLVMAMTVMVYADGDNDTTTEADTTAKTYSITIKKPSDSAAHTYEAYQIFTGDYANGKLSNIQWGTGITKAGQAALEKKYNVSGAAAVAEQLQNIGDDSTEAQELATFIAPYLSDTKTESKASGNGYAIENVAAGYYFIKDAEDSLKDADGNSIDAAYTRYVLEIVKNTEVTPKSDKPTVEKKVKDTNDSNGITSEWIDSADHDMKDTVDFKLTAKLPSNLSDYKTNGYKLVFHDTLSKGLSVDENTVFTYTIGDTTGTVTPTLGKGNNDSTEITITFDNLFTTKSNIVATDDVVITYSATLNTDAILGSTGNPNEVYLEYSNNPNSGGKGDTGKTEKDTVIVFTYKTVVNKVDQDGKALKGAAFTLYKFVANSDISEALKDAEKADVYKDESSYGSWVEIDDTDLNTITDGSTFEFKGLDDGVYKLHESMTPDGYNTIEDMIFEVTASHDEDSQAPTLTELNGNQITGTIELAASDDNSMLSTNVENKSGSTLPSTGGMGTKIFYVVGAVLVIGAGLILVTRKRAAK
jgi:fimbrial isopeptide formation D2 family protein/LPXTG-motif cell wall-anchored protein